MMKELEGTVGGVDVGMRMADTVKEKLKEEKQSWGRKEEIVQKFEPDWTNMMKKKKVLMIEEIRLMRNNKWYG